MHYRPFDATRPKLFVRHSLNDYNRDNSNKKRGLRDSQRGIDFHASDRVISEQTAAARLDHGDYAGTV
jgi:hypothetical protein